MSSQPHSYIGKEPGNEVDVNNVFLFAITITITTANINSQRALKRVKRPKLRQQIILRNEIRLIQTISMIYKLIRKIAFGHGMWQHQVQSIAQNIL